MKFAEELLELLCQVPNKATFMWKAKERARNWFDPLVRDELMCLVNNLPEFAEYYEPA